MKRRVALLVACLGVMAVLFAGCGRIPAAGVLRATQAGLTIQVSMRPDPPSSTAATNSLRVQVLRGQQPVSGAQVVLLFTMTAMAEMGAERQVATPAAAGWYDASASFAMGGQWNVTVQVRPPGANVASVSFPLLVSS